jgi:hypothetical protein
VLTVIHIGCRSYSRLPFITNPAEVKLIGFDADESAIEGRRTGDETTQFISGAVLDRSGTVTLHLTEKPEWSSVFAPNLDMFARYVGYGSSNGQRIHSQATFRCDTLDNQCAPLKLADHSVFLVINAQGATPEILAGATGMLGTKVFGAIVETEFLQQYRSQRLFGDVFNRMTALSFELFDFNVLRAYHRNEAKRYVGKGQAFYGDATFLKPDAICNADDLDNARARLKLITGLGYASFAYHAADQLDPEKALGLHEVVDGEIQSRTSRLSRSCDIKPIAALVRWCMDGLASQFFSIFKKVHPAFDHQKDANRVDRPFWY